MAQTKVVWQETSISQDIRNLNLIEKWANDAYKSNRHKEAERYLREIGRYKFGETIVIRLEI